jgi:hypothetical protein
MEEVIKRADGGEGVEKEGSRAVEERRREGNRADDGSDCS